MADISQINLPNGTTYDVVAKKVFMEGASSIGTSYVPLIATSNRAGSDNKDVIIPANGPEVDLDTGTVKLKMQSVDISNSYTFTKTSGGWKVSDIKATRSGNVVHLTIFLQGTGTSVSAGGNGVVGTLSGGPLPAQDHAGLVGYYGTSAMVANISNAGTMTVRNLISAQSLGSNTTSVYGCFITND